MTRRRKRRRDKPHQSTPLLPPSKPFSTDEEVNAYNKGWGEACAVVFRTLAVLPEEQLVNYVRDNDVKRDAWGAK